MTIPNRRKRGRKRRSEELKFAYSGPFAPLLDPIRVLPLTEERYVPDSAERYDIRSALSLLTQAELVARYSPFDNLTRTKRRRRGRRGGARRVAA